MSAISLFASDYLIFLMLLGLILLPIPKFDDMAVDVMSLKKATYFAVFEQVTVIFGQWCGLFADAQNSTIVAAAIGYMTKPLIMLLVLHSIRSVKIIKIIWIPAIVNMCVIAFLIKTGIVFTYTADLEFVRGPLGFMPHIVCLFYLIMMFVFGVRIYLKNRKMEVLVVAAFSVFAVIAAVFESLGYASNILDGSIVLGCLYLYLLAYLQYAVRDPLTKLYNRQAYYSAISKHQKAITGVISMDMNGLKEINDTRGHEAGDRALVLLANELLQEKKKNFLIYRMGGDEFSILCLKSSREEIEALVTRIRERMQRIAYSCSIGYAVCLNCGSGSVDEMVYYADQEMYQDKRLFYKNTLDNGTGLPIEEQSGSTV